MLRFSGRSINVFGCKNAKFCLTGILLQATGHSDVNKVFKCERCLTQKLKLERVNVISKII